MALPRLDPGTVLLGEGIRTQPDVVKGARNHGATLSTRPLLLGATLFLRWLGELLYIHDTQRFLFSAFDVHVVGRSLEGHARGEAIDKDRHELKLVIKAVTRHGLTVDPEKGIAEVIFDI